MVVHSNLYKWPMGSWSPFLRLLRFPLPLPPSFLSEHLTAKNKVCLYACESRFFNHNHITSNINQHLSFVHKIGVSV